MLSEIDGNLFPFTDVLLTSLICVIFFYCTVLHYCMLNLNRKLCPSVWYDLDCYACIEPLICDLQAMISISNELCSQSGHLWRDILLFRNLLSLNIWL